MLDSLLFGKLSRFFEFNWTQSLKRVIISYPYNALQPVS
jgi:hypothetical protein